MNSPKEIAQNYIATGVAKTQLPILKMLFLGVLAGMFIGLAGVGATIVPVTVAGTSVASIGRLLGAMVFPTGLVMVIFAGSELFTGNCLIIIPVLQKEVTVTAMLRNWVFVYIGNFIGGIIVAFITVHGGTYSLFNNDAAVAVINTAIMKSTLSFGDAFLRGVYCNFLVCIAVWISYASKDVVGRIVALFFPIMLFVVSGYEHSIANMYFIPAGIFASTNPGYLAAYTMVPGAPHISGLSWGSMFTNNLIPSTLGNIVGGMLLVGVVYWFIYLRGSTEKETLQLARRKKK